MASSHDLQTYSRQLGALVLATYLRKISQIHHAGNQPDHDDRRTHASPDVLQFQPSEPAQLVAIATMRIALVARHPNPQNRYAPRSAQIRAHSAPIARRPGEHARRIRAALVPNETAPTPPPRSRRDVSALYPHRAPLLRRRVHPRGRLPARLHAPEPAALLPLRVPLPALPPQSH